MASASRWSSSSSSSSSSSDIISTDYIGMENGYTDMKAIDEMLSPTIKKDEEEEAAKPRRKNIAVNSHQKTLMMKEFPPPISLLARTENLPSHMPWVLKRHYTCDGRLVMYEEKVRHHEYFKAHRENGRLTLHLIPMDNDFLSKYPPPDLDEGDHEVLDNGEEDHHNFKEADAKEREQEDVNLLEESMGKLACPKSDSSSEESGGSGGGKCLKYNTSTGNLFGLPVPAMS